MDTLFMEIIKSSPMLGLICIFWYYTRKDFKDFVSQVQTENQEREKNYQDMVKNLTEKVGVIEIVKNDVEEIKEKLK